MKKVFKYLLVLLLIILIIIQFFRPEKNKSTIVSVNDITKKFQVPEEVKKILKTACYDCHSNNTIYPWYAEVQPFAWWLSGHIRDGKRGLNFSEYGSYRLRKQYKRFEGINEQVKNGQMPLSSYTLIHRYAKLNDDQKLVIANWTVVSMNNMKETYPPDSLFKR